MTMIENALISAQAGYLIWQKDVQSHPFFSYMLWHLLLFVILLIIFYESRHGFRKTISIFSFIFHLFKRNGKDNDLNITISRYRDRSRKVHLSTVMIAVGITLSIAFVLYSELVFFSVVVSDSMNPTLRKGDLILVQNIYVKPEAGDIITAKVPDVRLPVMHRIVSISGDEIRTKGDANAVEDSWRIKKSQILGKGFLISGKPVVIHNLGYYFIVDASAGGKAYGPEFDAVSKLIRGVKAAGLMIFIACVILYLIISIRDAKRTRWE